MATTIRRRADRPSRRSTKAAVAAGGMHASPNPVASLRQQLALPRAKFARLLGRTERAVIDWESGKVRPQGLSQQRLRELERLTEALRRLFRPNALGPWFDTPNPAFHGLKPIEVIERGETDRLWQMIFELKAGTHA